MLRDPVEKLMDPAKVLMVSPDTTVAETAAQMAQRQVGAAMVVAEDGRLVGIATERDLVFRVMATGRDSRVTRVREIMTASPMTIDPAAPFGRALITMHTVGCRHLPVVEGDRPVGIVSSRNALDPELEEFSAEARRREAFELA